MDMDAKTEPRDPGAEAMRQIERRIVSHLSGEPTTDMAPDVVRNRAEAYVGVERLEQEKREIFGKLPIFACLSSEIPNPGDVTLFDVYGPSIAITRAKDGQVHAFLNMCTHHAGRLVRECGRRQLLTCAFHGWSFDLEGNVVGVPNRAAFEGVDMATRRLVRVPVGEWGGMIFIKLSPGDERIDVQAWLGGVGEALSYIHLPGARAIKSDVLDVEANWKYKVDTYGEAYHFNTVHPQSFAVTAIHDVVTYDSFGLHYRVNFVNAFYRDWVGAAESDWPETPYRAGHFIFPNTFVFAVYRESIGRAVTIYRIFPTDRPDRSQTYVTTYRPADSPARVTDADIAEMHDFTTQVVGGEDYPVAVEGTRNLLTAPADFEVLYGRNEIAVQDFQRNVARLLGQPID